MNVYIGCSGWYYNHWVDRFYPKDVKKSEWLQYYSQHFPIVEVNSTFYQLPAKPVIRRWAESTAPGFRFVIKGNRRITHEKLLVDVAADLNALYESVYLLSGKLDRVLWQFPPSFKREWDSFKNLERFCRKLQGFGLKSVFEFRDASWLNSDVLNLFERCGSSYVIADYPAFYRHFYIPASSDTIYMRMHGRNGDYYTSYSDEQLNQLAQRLNTYKAQQEIRSVYVLFNNDGACHSVYDAKRLMKLLEFAA